MEQASTVRTDSMVARPKSAICALPSSSTMILVYKNVLRPLARIEINLLKSYTFEVSINDIDTVKVE